MEAVTISRGYGYFLNSLNTYLKAILNAPHYSDVILIDDVRMFVGDKNYPTIPELRKMILSRRPQVSTDIEDDIIQILPKV
jgi:hypothetical protein